MATYISTAPPDALPRYLAEFEAWLRRGKSGQRPNCTDFALMVYETMRGSSEVEAKFMREHGQDSSWRLYDPAFYDPMMALRRKAVGQGLDPDVTAYAFAKHFWEKTGLGSSPIGRPGDRIEYADVQARIGPAREAGSAALPELRPAQRA